MSSLESEYSERFAAPLAQLEEFLTQLSQDILRVQDNAKPLQQAMEYALFTGGKRFRPLLTLLTGELFDRPYGDLLPYAAAVEMIHTYSLIHDDLPSMDNDDERRGRPTTHKVYGEALALLAGDALQTQAFALVLQKQTGPAERLKKALGCLTQAAGAQGMVGGQVADISAVAPIMNVGELNAIHNGKTGALIAASVEGAAHLCGASDSQCEELRRFGQNLGLAFQVADDILDSGDHVREPVNFLNPLSKKEASQYLKELTEQAQQSVSAWGKRGHHLKWLTEFNAARLR